MGDDAAPGLYADPGQVAGAAVLSRTTSSVASPTRVCTRWSRRATARTSSAAATAGRPIPSEGDKDVSGPTFHLRERQHYLTEIALG